jgi:hypothetical protein
MLFAGPRRHPRRKTPQASYDCAIQSDMNHITDFSREPYTLNSRWASLSRRSECSKPMGTRSYKPACPQGRKPCPTAPRLEPTKVASPRDSQPLLRPGSRALLCKGCSILLPSGCQTARPKGQNSARQRTMEHNQLIYLAPNITPKTFRMRKRPKKTASNARITHKPFRDLSQRILAIPIFIDDYNHYIEGIDQSNQL